MMAGETPHEGDVLSINRRAFSDDLFLEHIDDIGFLWELRGELSRSPEIPVCGLLELERRIESHFEALMGGGEAASELAERALLENEVGSAFAGASVLLRLGGEGRRHQVVTAFSRAQSDALVGIADALMQWADEPLLARVRDRLAVDEAHVRAASYLVLAFHGLMTPEDDGPLYELLRTENPRARECAWRALGFQASLGGATGRWPRVDEHAYRGGMMDEEPLVREEAMLAAAWSGESWLPVFLRDPSGNEEDRLRQLRILGILGDPGDLEGLISAAEDPSLGPGRFASLASYGHPGVMPSILRGLRSDEPADAVAAGAAFGKMIGEDVESDERVPIIDGSNPSDDDSEAEFVDEGFLPDVRKAEAHWRRVEGTFSMGSWWCRGLDFSAEFTHEILNQLDAESRWEVCVRLGFQGSSVGLKRAALEKFSFSPDPVEVS